MLKRLTRNLFGKKKKDKSPPESLEEACAFLQSENEDEIILALAYIEETTEVGLPSADCLSLVLECFNSDSGRIREWTFKVFQQLYGTCDVHYSVVWRKVARELGMDRGDAGATRAALDLINSMDVPYRVQYACSKIGAESIRKGMIATNPDIRAEIFKGVGRLLPVVWWYIDCSGDEVDGLYCRSVSVDAEEKCDWSAEECGRIRDDAWELIKQFYACCAQSLIREATTTDSMGNTVALEESSASFQGSSWALLQVMLVSNLRRRGLGLESTIMGLLGYDEGSGAGTVLPSAALPSCISGSISTYGGVHHSLLCHALCSSFNPLVQVFIHTCVAYMSTILSRAAEDPVLGVAGLMMTAQVLLTILHEATSSDDGASTGDNFMAVPAVQVIAKVKEKYHFGDEGEQGEVQPAISDPKPQLKSLLDQWIADAMEVVTAAEAKTETETEVEAGAGVGGVWGVDISHRWTLARDLVDVMSAPMAVSTLLEAGPRLLSWMVKRSSAGGGDGATRGSNVALIILLTELLTTHTHCDDNSSDSGSGSGSGGERGQAAGETTRYWVRAALSSATALARQAPSIGHARVLARCVKFSLCKCPAEVAVVLQGALLRSDVSAEREVGRDEDRRRGVAAVAVVVLRVALMHLHRAVTPSSVSSSDMPMNSSDDDDHNDEVAGACSLLLGLVEILLAVFKGESPPQYLCQLPQSCLLAWCAASSALGALLLPSAISPGTSCTFYPSIAAQPAAHLHGMQDRLSIALRGMVQLLTPHKTEPSSASTALLSLLCRHALSLAALPSCLPSSTAGVGAEAKAEVEEIEQLQALLMAWLGSVLEGSPTTSAPAPAPAAQEQEEEYADAEESPLPIFGADPIEADSRECSLFCNVVPSPYQLAAPSAAVDLCLHAHFRAVSLRKATAGGGGGERLSRALSALITCTQDLLSRYCRTQSKNKDKDKGSIGDKDTPRDTHSMLVEECVRASHLIAVATGIKTGDIPGSGASGGSDNGISPPSPSPSLQLRGALSGHWRERGGKDGTIMVSPVPVKGQVPGLGQGPDEERQRVALLAQCIRQLAIQNLTPAAAVAMALAPCHWTDGGERVHRHAPPPPCGGWEGQVSVPMVELVAATDDIIVLPPTPEPEPEPAPAPQSETAGRWEELDELPEPPTSRLYSQLSGSGDLLTVLGCTRYDHQRQCAEFSVRVCNSAGFTVPSLQLLGGLSLLGSDSVEASALSNTRQVIGIGTGIGIGAETGNNGTGSTRDRDRLPQLESPVHSFLGSGQFLDHVFRVPCTGTGQVQLTVTLRFSGLIDEGNGEAPSFSQDGSRRLSFRDSSLLQMAPMTMPPVATLRPYGRGLWSYFSRRAWLERVGLWTQPRQTVLRQLPSRAMASTHTPSSSSSLTGIPTAVFEELWQSLSFLTSAPALVPLQSPVARYGEELCMVEDASCVSFPSALSSLVDEAVALADAGVGGAALAGALNISSAARVTLHDPSSTSGADGASSLHRKRLAWALEGEQGQVVCVLVSIWTVGLGTSATASATAPASSSPLEQNSEPEQGKRHVRRVKVFAEAEVRASAAPLLASLTDSDQSLDHLLQALSGDVLLVDAEARAHKEGGRDAQASITDDWTLAAALRG